MKKETIWSIFFKILIFLTIPSIIGILMGFIIVFFGELSKRSESILTVFTLIISLIITGLYVINTIKKENNINIKDRINLKNINYKYLVGSSLLLINFNILFSEFLVKVIKLKATPNPEVGFDLLGILTIVSAIVFAPIFEEIIYRFGIMEKLQSKYKPIWAIIISTILFSVIHMYPLSGTLSIFMIFMAVSYIYYHTKNLIYPIVIHFVNNFIVLILIFINKYYPNIIVPKIKSVSIDYIVVGLLSVLGFYLMYKEHKKVKSNITVKK